MSSPAVSNMRVNLLPAALSEPQNFAFKCPTIVFPKTRRPSGGLLIVQPAPAWLHGCPSQRGGAVAPRRVPPTCDAGRSSVRHTAPQRERAAGLDARRPLFLNLPPKLI